MSINNFSFYENVTFSCPVDTCANVHVRLVCVCAGSSHHALVRILGLIGGVQQLAVLQLLAQPLQGVDWFVEMHRHGHLGQVLADVVPQDVPQAHAAVWAGRGQRGASTSQGQHVANYRGV